MHPRLSSDATRRRYFLGVAVGAACWSPIGAANPPLEKARPGAEVSPLRIAKVKKVNGRIVLDGGWIDYDGGARGSPVNTPFFDCYGHKPPPAPWNCVPGTLCVPSCDTAIDSGGRWYFGTAYHNPNNIEDMQDCACPPNSVISEIALGWRWDPPAPSRCIVIYMPLEEVLNLDVGSGLCDDESSFTATGPGVAIDYGIVTPVLTFYYYSCVDGLEGIGMLSPATDDNGDPNGYADGSYQQIFAESITSTGVVLAPGPCQPMLWGTSTNGTGPADCRPGHNDAYSYNDTSPADGMFDNPVECDDFTFGVCPDPLGKANCFSYRRCPADFNNDGFVDGIDADMFNNTYESAAGFNHRCADLNGDCFVDGIDADLFYNEFESACP